MAKNTGKGSTHGKLSDDGFDLYPRAGGAGEVAGSAPSTADPAPLGGPWTRHGHEIPGVTVAGAGRPPIARCGGPRMCHQCAIDAAVEVPTELEKLKQQVAELEARALTCVRCHGTGLQYGLSNKCHRCHGTGVEPAETVTYDGFGAPIVGE